MLLGRLNDGQQMENEKRFATTTNPTGFACAPSSSKSLVIFISVSLVFLFY